MIETRVTLAIVAYTKNSNLINLVKPDNLRLGLLNHLLINQLETNEFVPLESRRYACEFRSLVTY